jgi:hypothetical protein
MYMYVWMHTCMCVYVYWANKLEIHVKYHITPVLHVTSFVSLRSVTHTHGSVRIGTRPPAERLRNRGSIPGRVKRLFSRVHASSDGHMAYPAGVGRALSLGGTGAWERRSTHTSISCHRLITRGPIPPLRHTSLWCSAKWQICFLPQFRKSILHALCRYAGLLHSTSFCDNVRTTKRITGLIYMNRTVHTLWMTHFSLPFLRGSVWSVRRNRPSRGSE